MLGRLAQRASGFGLGFVVAIAVPFQASTGASVNPVAPLVPEAASALFPQHALLIWVHSSRNDAIRIEDRVVVYDIRSVLRR